ncbi:chain-length determining protein [Pseudarthrobacter sp. IC2-21]|uniref:chain-length determining protein n=1 Tax=Pseudarthrobacter sp. IC2-21 TaxID=3092262 RepID=UPI002A69962F|nr:chain-length determining protein [Pseudarthrobacter sp. IC2-21]
MDPIAVLRTVWLHRIVALPIIVLTVLAAVYVYQFAPRSYESSSTYAMINPDIPSEHDVLKNPQLGNLNPKNPYLRSSDPSLIVQVLLTKLNDSSTAGLLTSQGLSDEYTVSRGVGGINGFLVDITGEGETPAKSIATTQALGQILQDYLYDAQKVNGADDAYLFSSLVVATPVKATEQFSSRLRALIVVFLAGVVMMFGAVSIARSMAVNKDRRKLLTDEPDRPSKRRRGQKVATYREDGARSPDLTLPALNLDREPISDESKDLEVPQNHRMAKVEL